jgi:hypothetical protein
LIGAELLLRGLGEMIALPDALGAIPILALTVIGVAVQLGPLRR